MVKESSNARKKSPSRNEESTKASRRSPGRIKSPSSTSPARNKSPSRRSPARTKSPARKTKRDATSPVRKTETRKKSPSRLGIETKKAHVKLVKLDTVDLSASDEEEIVQKEKPKAAVRGRTRKTEEINTFEEVKPLNSYGIRRVTRNLAAQEERIVHLKHFELVSQKLGEFSDEDELTNSKQKITKLDTNWCETAGVLFQIITCPLLVFGLYVACNRTHCTFQKFPEVKFEKLIPFFFELRSMLGYFGFVILIGLLSILPFTGKKYASLPGKQERFVYVTNGFTSLISLLCTFIALHHFQQINAWKFINEHTVHFLSSAVCFGIVFSMYLYFRSFYVSLTGLNANVTSGKLSGFFYGREVNPRFSVLDLKIFILRISCITLILSDAAVLAETVKFNGRVMFENPTLLCLVLFHSIYSVDSLVFEGRILSSYFVQYEGLGYRTVLGLLLTPFLLVAQTKYVAWYNVKVPNIEMGVLALIYLSGYTLYRLSNNQKDSFRRNPYSPALAGLDSIQTAHGKKLISSGYWGIVRQPNILGDLIMHSTLLRFGYEAPAIIGVVVIILMLVERAMSGQMICKARYGSSWEKYCQKVRYVLIPKIY